jgi:predicted TIM-barrel fold metal-dependent hydrolase
MRTVNSVKTAAHRIFAMRVINQFKLADFISQRLFRSFCAHTMSRPTKNASQLFNHFGQRKTFSTDPPITRHMIPPTPPPTPDGCSKGIELQRTSILQAMPVGAWDSHMHIIGNIEKYPLVEDARYIPSPHAIHQALSFERNIGVQTMVLVQPSIYGYDNSCLLDALRLIGPERARGVVAFCPGTVSSATLREWHKLGVRGVRLNLKSVDQSLSDGEFSRQLQAYADAIRPLGWVLQLYVPMAMLPLLERIAGDLNITLCLDHFGSPDLSSWDRSGKAPDPRLLEGWQSLLRLVSAGRTFVKISAPYRLGTERVDEDMLAVIVAELSRYSVGRRRLIWASDWPHTRFEGLDITNFTETVLQWCGMDDDFKDRLFRDNAIELWR